MKPVFAKGHVINGPSGQGYRITRDVHRGEFVSDSDFEPIGGAPEPMANVPMEFWMVDWLADAVFSR